MDEWLVNEWRTVEGWVVIVFCLVGWVLGFAQGRSFKG